MENEPIGPISPRQPEKPSGIRNTLRLVTDDLARHFPARALLGVNVLLAGYLFAPSNDAPTQVMPPALATYTPYSRFDTINSFSAEASPTPNLSSKGVIKVEEDIITWSNESNLAFNEVEGADIFRQLNRISKGPSIFPIELGANRDGEVLWGDITKRESLTLLKISSVDPSKSNRNVTYIDTAAGFAASEIYTSNSEDKMFDNNRAFAVEACQSALDIKSSKDASTQLILQEGFCNSWGYAVAMRKSGVSYEKYVEDTQGTGSTPGIGFYLFEGGPFIKALVIPEHEYMAVSPNSVFSIK